MSIIFGSARIDENGNTHGGSAGDQTGNEVSTQEFYMHSKGWYGYRPKSVDVANALATAMQQACDNNNIGYDQYERGTLLTQYKKYGSIKAISVKCECDCSSLVRVCIYQASGVLLSDFDTSGEPSVLASSGLFDKITVNSSADVCNGDVLVTKSKGHTGIIVSGRARSGSSSSSGSGTTSSTTTVEAAASGPDSSIAGTYKVNASGGLNVRYGAGTDKAIRTTLSNGTSVQNYGYYTTVSGTKWLLIQMNDGATGFASSKYLTKTSSSSSSSGTTSSTSGTTSSSSSLTVDGQIGQKTVTKLQKVMGSTQDGFIDGQPSASKKYWTSILTEACKWSGGTSAVVKKLQQFVKDAGYSPGTVDGKLGTKTAKALQKYLIAKGYSCGSSGADGYFGTNSAKALQNWLNKQ